MSEEHPSTSEPAAAAESDEPNTADLQRQDEAELDAYITENAAKIETKEQLRKANSCVAWPSEDDFTKLDSSLKKNTAFVKKLKQFTASQLDSLLRDMAGLNLTKYISEVSSALSETKIKIADIPAAITLCSQLHQTYQEFSKSFFENWQRALSLRPGEKVANPSKMRVDLRFFSELISCGIFGNKTGLNLLGNVLITLIAQDKEEHNNISIVLSFCKSCGEEFAGLVSARMIELSQKYGRPLPRSTLLTPEKQQNLRNLLKSYYASLCTHVVKESKELQNAERNRRRQMEMKGEISEERREQLEQLQANFQKLFSAAQALSDLLNEPMPELPKEKDANEEGGVLEFSDEFSNAQLDPWGDEDTKCFYVDLPDLREFLPNYCAPKEVETPEEPPMSEEVLDEDIEPELDVDETVPPPSAGTPEPPEEEPAAKETEKTASTQMHNKAYLATFFGNLVNCVNKELIDSAAIDFLLNLNTKNNRKKLVKALFGVQRTRLDLLPLYARLVAIINLVATDVAVELCQMLKVDFKFHVKKRDQINIESKIKVVRFIGELTKFGLYAKVEALFCLKVLLHNFSHHQIEMTCAFLEVCGQYLYNCRESRMRTNAMLEQMMRLKTAHSLDSRHVAQVEAAYYLVKPPEGVGVQLKVRPPMQQYIRHLIFEELNKNNVEKVIKLMRRLNWDDPEVAAYAIRCLTKAYLIRYHLIRCLADLLSGLSSYQDKVVVKVIDAVFEDVRAGLEIHSPKLAQRRIAMAKYLGELYNYRLIEANDIINTLYLVISLGVTFSYEMPSDVDPPGSLFRLKLACVLLDTCGLYFTKAAHRRRLDYFLVFLQHYYWFKKADPVFRAEEQADLFPILVDHMYRECLLALRPKLKFFRGVDEAKEAVEALRAKLYPNLFADGGGAGDGSTASGLDAIAEDEDDATEENTSEAVDVDSDDEAKPRERREVDDDEDDGSASDEETRESTPPPQPTVAEKTQEDLEFEQMFERLAQESYAERMRDTLKAAAAAKDIPVPMTARGSTKKTYEQLQAGTDADAESGNVVPFVLMLRGSKAGKQQFKTFRAPSDSALAVNLKLQREKIQAENEKVKQLTLERSERLEMEDYEESLQQSSQAARNRNYVKPVKFKHQKGAPDADAIFN